MSSDATHGRRDYDGPEGEDGHEEAGESVVDLRTILMFLLNVVVKTGVLLLFHVLGWLKLAPVVSGWGVWGVVGTSVLLAAVFAALFALVTKLLMVAGALTCGVGWLLLPVSGFFTLWGMLELTPQLVTAPNDRLFVVLVLGLLIGLATVPTKRRRQPTQPQSPTTNG